MRNKIITVLATLLTVYSIFCAVLTIIDLNHRVKDLEKQVDIQYRMWQDTQNRMWEHIGNDERHNK